jgi:site-specific DNA recombinase
MIYILRPSQRIHEMNVAIYARVSKDEVSSEGQLQNPENQLVPLRKFCEAMQWSIYKEYVDCCSGGDGNRPAFIRMRADLRQHLFDGIVIWRLDRFSREGIPNTMGYINELRLNNIWLKSMQESYIDTRNEGITDLILSCLAWAASEERKKISDNTKAGLARARLNGSICGRHPKNCQCPKHAGKNAPPPS